MTTTLDIRTQGRIARVHLNRPEVRNAFNDGVITELADTFTRLVRARVLRAVSAIAAALIACAAVAQQPALDERLRETVEMIPSSGFTEPELELTHFRPPGAGPFPVVVINHGRAEGNAKFQARYRPMTAAREFVGRGYAVLVPMRQGFSRSGGQEISGGCNVHSNGLQQARSVRRTIDWAARQPWADVTRIVVVGQSHGGLTTLAYGTEAASGVKLLVNFAGGLRQTQCSAWEHTLARAFGDYGSQTRIPSIWFYGDNDSYFSPWVWRAAHDAYTKSGGKAELVAFGSFGGDAHGMFGSKAGLGIWVPRVVAALERTGLPTEVLHTRLEEADIATPPPSGYASLEDRDKLPPRAREAYGQWLRARPPKAFALHPVKGSYAWAWGGERPYSRALANCTQLAKDPCRLYAVDDQVVWTEDSKP